MNIQVNKSKYNFNSYCQIERWASYWHQINEILKIKPKSVLEIGVGSGVVSGYFKHENLLNYKTLDIDKELNPDFVGSVDNMNFNDNEYDTVCAFEVLEHLPFEKFEKCLLEMKRVARDNVIISLPYWGRYFSFEFRLPFFKKIRGQFKLSFFPVKHKFNGEHYWEIGKKSYSLDRIKKIINNIDLEIVNDFMIFESPYHHFFVLKK